jgi:hypothetical protein
MESIKNCHKRTKISDQKLPNADLPHHLKQGQQNQVEMQHIDILHFNENIHVDTFQEATEKGPSIITVTDDENTAYSISMFTQDKNQDNLLRTLNTQWFNKFGFPQQIHLK